MTREPSPCHTEQAPAAEAPAAPAAPAVKRGSLVSPMEGTVDEPQVKVGDHVTAGQLLIKFDIDGIKAKGYDMTTPVVITNSDDLGVKPLAEGEIVPDAELLKWE